MQYPLPRASQEWYTKFFQTTIKKGALSGFTIQWVGQPLTCRFKSDRIKNILSPQNVFILKKGNAYEYALIDDRGNCYKLPRKFFTVCFPNISLNAVPEDNRFEIQITKRKKIKLPFIPDSFLEQKKTKTSRKRRKLYHTVDSPPVSNVESIDYNVSNVPSWHVLQNTTQNNRSIKKEIVHLIRSVIALTDSSSFILSDPFESVENIDDLIKKDGLSEKFKVIISFIFHYCRQELGLHVNSEPMLKTAAEFLASLSV